MSEALEAGTTKRGRKRVGTALGLLALAVAVLAVAQWSRQINQVAIPENRAAFVVLFLSAAALGVGAFVAGTRWYGAVAAVPAIFLGLLLPFTMAISQQEVGARAIQVGDTIPHFTAVDDGGQDFDSDSLRGQPVLMKFFRAHW